MQVEPHDNVQGNGKLLQIKSSEDHRGLELIDLWTCLIPAKLSNTVVNYLRDKLPPEPVPIPHLRRLAPDNDEPDKSLLRLLVCTVEAFPNKDELQTLVRHALTATPPKRVKMKKNADGEKELVVTKKPKLDDESTSSGGSAPSIDISDPKLATLEIRQGAKYQAHTKEQSVEWSETGGSWPIMWRGNPAAVKTPLSESELECIVKYLKQVQEMCKAQEQEIPVATIVVNPSTDTIVSSSCDKRNASCPLDHSVMRALRMAADKELDKRRARDLDKSTEDNSDNTNHDNTKEDNTETYLCLDMHVYTSHEPCVMCAMALVHSRIARLVYVESSPETGAIEPTSGAGLSVHWNRLLNWTYQAWKWLDKSDFPDIPLLDPKVNA